MQADEFFFRLERKIPTNIGCGVKGGGRQRQGSDGSVFFAFSHFLVCCIAQTLLNSKIWLLMSDT